MMWTKEQVENLAKELKATRPIIHNDWECTEIPKEFMTLMNNRSMNAINFEHLRKLMPEYEFSRVKGLPNYYATKRVIKPR